MPMDPKQLKRILETFSGELEERLLTITQSLLSLEKLKKGENNASHIESIFRAAHNIKGTSRSLGINNISEIAHHIESLFANVQKEKKTLTSADIDLCLEAVDKMRMAMQAFIKNDECPFDLADILKRLDNGLQKNSLLDKNQLEMQNEKLIGPKTSISTLDHDTIRISTDNIQHLNALLEEMQINHQTIKNNFVELTKIIAKTDKHSSDNFQDLVALQKSMRLQMNEMTRISSALINESNMLRLVPAAYWLQTLPRIARDLGRKLNKEINLTMEGEEVKLDKLILDSLKEPIIHLLRNAIDHGIETQPIRQSLSKPAVGHVHIKFEQEGKEILLTISDDGAGIDVNKVMRMAVKKKMILESELAQTEKNHLLEFIFLPGFSTKEIITDVSGRGVGLDIVKANVEELKGHITVRSESGKGTTFLLRLPLTLVGERGLLVASHHQTFVIPSHAVERIISLKLQDFLSSEGSKIIMLDEHPIPLRNLAMILRLNTKKPKTDDNFPVVVIQVGSRKLALLVDDIIKEEEIMIKRFSDPISKAPCIAGGTLSGKGEVIIVLNPADLIHYASELTEAIPVGELGQEETIAIKPHILVADDSITTRTLEKNILENKGYRVTVAVDGKEAWDLLQKEQFALLITDVVMPNMDGFTLTETIKKSNHLKHLPVIIVTSLGSDAEKKHGIEAGADAYIVKSAFESGTLLDIMAQLI